MRDRPPDVEKLVRELIMAMSAEERFIRGALMFDAAREMILASFDPNLRGLELRRKLHERLYGEPLPEG